MIRALAGFLVFHASCVALILALAVSSLNGGLIGDMVPHNHNPELQYLIPLNPILRVLESVVCKQSVTYDKSASFLSIVTLKDGNGRAPCRNFGFEPSLFTIIKEASQAKQV